MHAEPALTIVFHQRGGHQQQLVDGISNIGFWPIQLSPGVFRQAVVKIIYTLAPLFIFSNGKLDHAPEFIA